MTKGVVNLALVMTACPPVQLAAVIPLTDQADAIVVGEVTSGQQTGSFASFIIRVDRALKGSLAVGSPASVVWDKARVIAGAPRQLSGDYGVWFLRRQGTSAWQLIPAPWGNGPTPLGLACYPLPKGTVPISAADTSASPQDLIALELAAGVEGLPFDGIRFYRSAEALLSLPASPTTVSQFRRLSQSPNPQVQIIGAVGLLREGDVKSLLELRSSPEAWRSSNLSGEIGLAVRHIRSGAPAIVQALGQLATLPGVPGGIQTSAADALRAIHTTETLPFLAALLDSPDPQIRWHGLAGLSMFVENLPIQTLESMPGMTWLIAAGPAPYRTADTDRYSAKFGVPPGRQAEYGQFWKNWWTRMQTGTLSSNSKPNVQ